MRKQLFPFLFVFSVTIVSAQSRVAIVGGLNNTSVSPFLNPQSAALTTSETKRMGPRFGFLADLAFREGGKVFFQPGAYFSNKGTSHQQQLDTSVTKKVLQYTTEQNINYIDIPLNLVLKLPLKGKTKFILGAGPQASLFYNGSSSISTIDTSGSFKTDKNEDLPVGKNDQSFRVIHFSVNGIAGFEFGRIFLTAHYSKSLTPFYQQNEQEFEYTTMGASLGIFLGKMVQAKKPVANNDRDKDGIVNSEDGCPDQPGSKAANGCPDSDADGIADLTDKCPSLAGTARNNGCPVLDKDSDGINDETDRCPDVAGLPKYNGCPVPDADKDGVNDEDDGCPNQPGKKENKGCPEIKKEVIERVTYAARKIQFQLAKADLKQESYKVLDEVIKLLKEDAQIKITIEGHTSSDGTAQANEVLSQKRADKVKEYMIANGISAERVTAIGFGASRPLVTETSESNRTANRRVEMKLSR